MNNSFNMKLLWTNSWRGWGTITCKFIFSYEYKDVLLFWHVSHVWDGSSA